MAALTLEESARLVHRYRWVEARSFEVLGGWVAVERAPEVQRLFGVQAHHHAWHAALWEERLPSCWGASPPVVDGVTPELEAFLAAVAEPAGPDATVERLVGMYRVLVPHKLATYRRHLAGVSPVADGPVTRALRLVLQDEVEDWQEGEALLQARLTTPALARRAAEHQGDLEALLVAAGGITGAFRVAPASIG